MKEAFGPALEFANNSGEFQFESYPANTIFNLATGNEASQSVAPSSVSTPQSSQSTSRSNSNTPILRNQRRVLASVRVVRADIDSSTGRPQNMQLHNHTVHISIYSEEQACVPYIESRIREEMLVDDLVIVGPNGLTIYDQEGTRGNS